MTEWIDFKLIKETVSIAVVLDHYKVAVRQYKEGALRGTCPLPTHSSKRDGRTFAADTKRNVWVCQSASCAAARGGRKGGNVLDLVALMEGCNVREAALMLRRLSGSVAKTSVTDSRPIETTTYKTAPSKEEGEKSGDPNQPLTFSLKDVNAAHPYVMSRNLGQQTIQEFGVGFFPGRGSMTGRVVIPIHNGEGSLVAYAGRAIDGSEPKYKLPLGFKKSLELYNLNRVLGLDQQSRKQVIVVEGFFDCMKVHDAGFRNVIALMGCTLSEFQADLLIRNFREVVLLLDGDDAGREAVTKITSSLVHRQFVRVADLPDGSQPDQLSNHEIQRLLAAV